MRAAWFLCGVALMAACGEPADESTDESTDETDVGADQAPPPPVPRIRPATPYRGEALAVVWDPVVDPDGDTVEYLVRWTTDDPNATFQAREQTIPGDQVRRGFTWTVSVIARTATKDSEPGVTSVEVLNAVPEVTELVVTPTVPFAGSTMRGTLTVSDPEGDRLTNTWTWKVDGATVLTGVGENTFLGTDLVRGDEVTVEVQVDDGQGGIAFANAGPFVVANSAPFPPRVGLSPATPSTEDDLVCTILAPGFDPDGDALTYTYRWESDRTGAGSVPGTTNLSDTVASARTSNGQVWACTVQASDGVDVSTVVGKAVVVGAEPPDIATLSLGNTFNCAARSDGHTVCWGDDLNGRAASPELGDLYLTLASGNDFTCGLRPGGEVGCWGYGGGIGGTQTKPPVGTFVALDVEGGHACGLATDRTLACWGTNLQGSSNPPEGTWKGIAVGIAHGCAIDDDNVVSCWGRNTLGQTDAPVDTVALLRAGGETSCAIRTDRSIACWGDNGLGQATPPVGSFRDLAVGGGHACAISQTDDTLACWGDNTLGQATPPTGSYDRVWLGAFHSCAQDLNGGVSCWGDDIGGITRLPVGQPIAYSVGAASDCVVDEYGLATCTGLDLLGYDLADPPYGDFVQIDVYDDFGCGVQANGTLLCWGNNAGGKATPPSGTYTDVSVGSTHACAIASNKDVVCWGIGTAGSINPPAGLKADALDAGTSHSCAVKIDGSLACWGLNLFGQSNPPATGTFSAVTAGGNHSCAIDTADDSVRCWGFNTFGQARNQTDAYVDIAGGEFHTCGVKADGTLKCWGQGLGGVLQVPKDTLYSTVSASTGASCAQDIDGGLWCWGAMQRRPLSY